MTTRAVRSIAASAIFCVALLLSSCASAPPVRGPAPRALELREERQISTFHFPPGVYSYADSDETGFYYAAPRHVIKHGFPGSIPYDGGLFVARNDHAKVRAYVIWAGGRTKIGNLSRADYVAVQ